MTLDTAKSLPAHGIRLIELDIAKIPMRKRGDEQVVCYYLQLMLPDYSLNDGHQIALKEWPVAPSAGSQPLALGSRFLGPRRVALHSNPSGRPCSQ
jgi:hypothetical protein